MTRNTDHEKTGDDRSFPALILQWLTLIVQAVMELIREGAASLKEGNNDDASASSMAAPADKQIASPPYPAKKKLLGLIQSGVRKYELAQRFSAMQKKYDAIRETIKVTRKSIKKAPKDTRRLFTGYLDVLKGMDLKVQLLAERANAIREHLQRYNPADLEDEIRRLEGYLRKSESDNSEAQATLAARKELLETICTFEEILSSIESQFGHIAANLELNHIRIVKIAGRTGTMSPAESEMLDLRMEELTEQLALLDESLHELDEM